MTAPQGNGAPAPPSPSTLLADFDPTRHREDRAGGGWTGTIPSPVAHAYTFDGTTNYAAASSPPVVDHSAAVPYTVYAVVRPSADDVAGTGGARTICSTSVEGSSGDFWATYFIVGGLRLLVAAGAVASLNDKAVTLVEGQTYVIAFEFASLTELNIWVDGVEDTATVTSRDPGDFNAFSWGKRAAGTAFYSSPTLLRGLVYSEAYDADVTAYLAGLYDYSPSAAPDAAFDVLSDWDPSFSYTVDRTAALTYAESGTGFSRVKVGGNWCAEFDGSGALVASGAPFTTLSDLTGGVSIYVVAERTDVAATAKALLGIGRDTGTIDNFDIVSAAWNSTNVSVNVYDAAGGATLDTTTDPGRNTVAVLSLHATTTARTAKLDGVGTAEASGTTRDPAGMDFFSIGASLLFSASPPLLSVAFPGRIYRVLVCEGAYDADVLTYLAGLYQ